MVKAKTPLAPKGAATAQELYLAIGLALSYWESAEDEILGLFRVLCDGIEPIAVEAFIQAPRNVRGSMFLLAMKTYHYRFEAGEIDAINSAVRSLDKLARTRNEIAHGHVAQYNSTVDGKVEASGNYLLPSFNEGEYHERNFRFHHTLDSLSKFLQDVRKHRAVILDQRMGLLMRTQTLRNFGSDASAFAATVARAHRLEIHGYDAVQELARVAASVLAQHA